MIDIKELAKAILKEKSVAVFCHIRPDGDAVGSLLALTKALNDMGVEADAYCEDDIPKKFNYLFGASEIQKNLTKEYSAYVAVDSAEINRLGKFSEIFAKKNANTYSIDHHVSNTRYAKVNFVVDKPSNCENVFDFLTVCGYNFTSEVANALATGILTDTGNFKHKGVPSDTLVVASKLVDFGADLNDINYRMFDAQSKERANLFGKVMSKIRYLLNGDFAIITITLDDLTGARARRDETEGFIDFVMGIEGVKVGAAIMEMGSNNYKISLRSKKTDVNKVAGVFGGGGHILASGCQIQGEYEEVVDRLRYVVSQYIEE